MSVRRNFGLFCFLFPKGFKFYIDPFEVVESSGTLIGYTKNGDWNPEFRGERPEQ